jgi:hypothetical protein
MADDRNLDELSTEELDAVAGGVEGTNNCTNGGGCNSVSGCGSSGSSGSSN